MKQFKTFAPKVDKSRILVLTRFYTGVGGSNNFCYQISKITKKGTLDKKFKPLFCFGTDDFSSVSEFQHSGNGEKIRVFKTPFKSVFGIKEKSDPVSIWNKI